MAHHLTCARVDGESSASPRSDFRVLAQLPFYDPADEDKACGHSPEQGPDGHQLQSRHSETSLTITNFVNDHNARPVQRDLAASALKLDCYSGPLLRPNSLQGKSMHHQAQNRKQYCIKQGV
jgi:hypothetical protein